jgi:hypothetical protein
LENNLIQRSSLELFKIEGLFQGLCPTPQVNP